jgi:hypothetical protein
LLQTNETLVRERTRAIGIRRLNYREERGERREEKGQR